MGKLNSIIENVTRPNAVGRNNNLLCINHTLLKSASAYSLYSSCNVHCVDAQFFWSGILLLHQLLEYPE